MELRQLRAFYEIVTEGSMKKASEKLFISQPAMSIAVKNLENELNTQLFIRNAKSLIITEKGKELIPIVRNMILLEKEVREICNRPQKMPKIIRLNIQAGSALVQYFIRDFHEKYPDIELMISQGKPSENDFLPDLTIFTSQTASINKLQQTILRERIMLVVPSNHELASRKYIEPKELEQYQLINLKGNFALRDLIDFYANQENIHLTTSIECDNPSILRTLVHAGLGFALVPEKSWLMQKQNTVVMIPINSPQWQRNLIIEKNKFAESSQYLDTMIELIKKSFSLT